MNLVQLGTNNGNDHVLHFVRTYNKELNNIILVEPVSELIPLIKENYNGYNIKVNKT